MKRLLTFVAMAAFLVTLGLGCSESGTTKSTSIKPATGSTGATGSTKMEEKTK